jgi:thiopeptide-type bacteriocin biosynthesis protein
MISEITDRDSSCALLRPANAIKEKLHSCSGLQPIDIDLLDFIQTKLTEVGIDAPRSLVHVDSYLESSEPITLNSSVVAQIESEFSALGSVLTVPRRPLGRFVRRFEERYGSEFVPLLDALDEDIGLGFANLAKGVSPLTKGLGRGASPSHQTVGWNPWQTFLANRVLLAAKLGIDEVELKDEELSNFANQPNRFPSAFSVLGAIHAQDSNAIDEGDFRFEFKYAVSPESAALLGRFCNGHAGLEERVRALSDEQQEGLADDAVFAEVVHVPEGRVGNVLQRPRNRDYEINFFGRSTGRAERISAKELNIGIVNGDLILWSDRLQKRIIPRLTSAHNFGSDFNLPIYRFLGLLQGDGDYSVQFAWGEVLNSFESLPRVRYKHIVLSRARWSILPSEINELKGAKNPKEASSKLLSLFTARAIPKQVELVQGDNVIEFDVSRPGQAQILVGELVKLGFAFVQETGRNIAPGEGHSITNEIVLPATGSTPEVEPKPLDRHHRPAMIANANYAPGGEWLYAKLYTGAATADRIIAGPVREIIEQARRAGCDSAFFIRYRDPEYHIRVRVHGDPATVWGAILPSLTALVKPLVESRIVSRIVLDTYVPEISRYGGEVGTALAEQLFTADSEFVTDALAILGVGDPAERWKCAAIANFEMCDVFDQLIPGAGLAVLDQLAEGFQREFGFNKSQRKTLNSKFRDHREFIIAVAKRDVGDPHVNALAKITKSYSEKLQKPAQTLVSVLGEVELTEIIGSYLHMTNNRLFQDNARLQELVVYDMLRRGINGLIARRKYAKSDASVTAGSGQRS